MAGIEFYNNFRNIGIYQNWFHMQAWCCQSNMPEKYAWIMDILTTTTLIGTDRSDERKGSIFVKILKFSDN